MNEHSLIMLLIGIIFGGVGVALYTTVRYRKELERTMDVMADAGHRYVERKLREADSFKGVTQPKQ